MAKYSYEFKLKVVQSYLEGAGSYVFLANKYNIPAKKTIEQWVSVYKKFGREGLQRSRKNKQYSFQFKLSVVELYLTSEVSYQELALSQGINNSALITQWVTVFRNGGADALRPKKKGRKSTLENGEKDNSVKTIQQIAVDTSAEHLKELENENLRLRIENAYLKELRRLRLEEEALLKKQRESSAASEENSN